MKQFKLLFAFVIGLLTTANVTAAVGDTFTAATPEGVSVTYKVLTEGGTTGTYTVQIGEGSAAAIATSTTALTIPATVTNGGVTYTVTSIANAAFNGCTSLSVLTIEDSNETLEMGYGQAASSSSDTGKGLFKDCPLTTVYVGRNLSYSFNTDNNQYGRSPFAFINTITNVTIGDAVTFIYAQLFRETGITSIVIPNQVTSLGKSAFYSCTALENITFPTSLQTIGIWTFGNCTSLTTLTLPNSVTSLDQCAFRGCSNLETITLSSSLTTIGGWAFQDCSKLETITLPSTLTTIGQYAFKNSLKTVTLPSTLTTIGQYAFSESNLTSIHFPDAVRVISDHAFYNCQSLTTVTVSENSQLTTIGQQAFYDCTALTSIQIPDAVTEIGGSALSGCSSLTTVTLTENSQLETIGSYAFAGCRKLASIYLPPSLTLVESSAFNATQLFQVNISDIAAWCSIDFQDANANPMNCWSNTSGVITVYADLYLNGTKVEDLEFPNDVTSIGNFAFYGCKSLKSVAIPASITTIGDKVFALCANLTTLTFAEDNQLTSIGLQFVEASGITEISWPSNLITIGPNVFYGANKLETVHIPNTVTAIDDYAFYGCTNLKSVDIPSGITSIGRSAFYLCRSLRAVFCNPQTAPTLLSDAWSTGEISYSYVLGYTRQRLLVYPNGSNYSTWEGVYSNNHNWYFYIGEHFIVDGCLYQTHGYYDQVVLKAVSSEAIQNGVVNIPEYVSYGDKSYYVKWILEGAFEENGSNIERLYVNTNTPPELLKDGLAGLPETCDIYVPSSSVNSYESSWGERDYKTFLSKYAEFTVPVSVTNNGTTSQVDMKFKVTSTGLNPTVQVGDGSNSSINSSTAGEIVIPSTVTYEGETFTVTSLSSYAFRYCNNIKKMTIPSTVTEIKDNAVGCSSLERLYLESSDPTAITVSEPISSIGSNCILVVPVGSKTDYQNSVWSNFFSYIKEVGHEEEWLPGDMFYVYMELGDDYDREISFKILTAADGDTPGTVQIGTRDYDNTDPLEEDDPIPSVFYYDYITHTPVTIPESVEFNGTTYTITTIGAYAFSWIDRFEKLVLPSTITTIGYHAFEHSSAFNLCVNTNNPPTLIPEDDNDDSPFNWYFYDEDDGCTLFVPDGCVEDYSDWEDYFLKISEAPKPVVICGVEYKQNAEIDLGEGNGSAVLSWEYEYEESSIIKGGDYDDERVPVLTLNGATINYTGGPAIEVNSFPRFYIRVKGTNSITATNAAAAISIGTNKGVDLSQTSLIFLSDDVPTDQGGSYPGGGEMKKAPRRRTAGTRSGTSLLPTLTITNSTTGDGVYVYQGSFNVQDCDVTVTGQKYGLEFGVEESSGNVGPVAPTKAPFRKTENGPKKVTPVDGPVSAVGWLNIYEGSGLTLNGNEAALWGATGDSEWINNERYYFPGYLQNVSLMDSDKGEGESGPTFFPAGYNDENITFNGSYYIDDQNSKRIAKYLKFGCDYFIATTEEGIRMKFVVTDETNHTCQVGDYDEQSEQPIIAIDQETYGSVTIPSQVNGYDVTSICMGAFYQCYDINAVSIPASVNTIGVMAFGNCNYLSTVTCYATTPPTLQVEGEGENTITPFTGAGSKDGMVLYVPASSVQAYLAAEWDDYFEQILPIGSEGYVFTAKTPENVKLTYLVIDVDETTNKTLVQVGTGQGSSVVSTPNGWDGQLTVPATVTDETGKEYFVIGLADYALYHWQALRSVTISEGIQYLGTGLAGWGAFEGDENLQTLHIASTVVSLEEWCFNSCSNLNEVYIYAVEPPTLGSSAFNSGRNILYVPEGCVGTYENTAWSNYFNNIVEMEDQSLMFTILTPQGNNIVPMTFKITGENTVQTYSSTQRIYDSEYEEYYNMPVPAIPANTGGSITIPETVEYEGVTYTVTAIGNNSFACCPITGVTIPASVTAIGSQAFAGAHLNSVTVLNEDPDATELHYDSNYDYYDAFSYTEHCKLFVPTGTLNAYQESESWPQCFNLIREIGDTSIGNGDIFYADNGDGEEMCFMITDVENQKVKTYGYWTWNYAVTAIRSDFSGALTIPETVTYNGVTYTVTAVGDESFDADGLENFSLTSVVIPNTVTSIGWYAFCDCNLENVYIYAVDPPALNPNWYSFSSNLNATLYVPAGTKALYDESDWAQYFGNGDRIVEMEGGDVEEGDINGDSEVNSGDVMAIYSVMAGNGTPEMQARADVNGDGNVDSGDIMAIYSIMAGHAGH